MPPWITTGALEQANDTKELNPAQLPYAERGKLVDNPVGISGTIGQTLAWIWIRTQPAVDTAPEKLLPSTRYQQVFPYLPTRTETSDDLSDHRRGASPAGAVESTRTSAMFQRKGGQWSRRMRPTPALLVLSPWHDDPSPGHAV
jgi:hypothetical protein